MKTSDLETLLEYYLVNRRVGHTSTMIEGAYSTDCIILVANQSHSNIIKRDYPGIETVSISSPDMLRGYNKPLLIDNYAMIIILQTALTAIKNGKNKLLKIKTLLNEIYENYEN